MTFSMLYLVPNIPQAEIVPSYSSDSQALQKLFIVRTENQTVSDLEWIIIIQHYDFRMSLLNTGEI